MYTHVKGQRRLSTRAVKLDRQTRHPWYSGSFFFSCLVHGKFCEGRKKDGAGKDGGGGQSRVDSRTLLDGFLCVSKSAHPVRNIGCRSRVRRPGRRVLPPKFSTTLMLSRRGQYPIKGESAVLPFSLSLSCVVCLDGTRHGSLPEAAWFFPSFVKNTNGISSTRLDSCCPHPARTPSALVFFVFLTAAHDRSITTHPSALHVMRCPSTTTQYRVCILLPTAGENLEVVFKALVGALSQRLWDSGLPGSQTLRVIVLDEKRRLEVYRVAAGVHRIGELLAGRRIQQILMVRVEPIPSRALWLGRGVAAF